MGCGRYERTEAVRSRPDDGVKERGAVLLSNNSGAIAMSHVTPMSDLVSLERSFRFSPRKTISRMITRSPTSTLIIQRSLHQLAPTLWAAFSSWDLSFRKPFASTSNHLIKSFDSECPTGSMVASLAVSVSWLRFPKDMFSS